MSEEKEPEIIDLAAMKDVPILEKRERLLSVKLTDDEWATFAEKQSETFDVMDKLEATEKARRSVWNGEHKSRQSAHRDLVEIVNKRAEYRHVEVVDYAIRDENHMVTVRTDTGEVLNRKVLTDDQVAKLAQQELPLPPEPEPEPMPKGVKALAKYIKAGDADDKLNALDADSRKGVENAVAARREVLLALDIAEAEADRPQKKSL